jgi:hypothetical protein
MSDEEPTLRAIDEEAHHQIVHRRVVYLWRADNWSGPIRRRSRDNDQAGDGPSNRAHRALSSPVHPENLNLFIDLTFLACLLMLDQRTLPSFDTP